MGLTAEGTLLFASLGRATNAGLIEAAASSTSGSRPSRSASTRSWRRPIFRLSARRSVAGPSSPRSAREAKEGGSREIAAEAAALLGAALDAGFDLVDVEFARAGRGLLGLPRERVVVSAHDVDGVPDDLEERAARMEATGARYREGRGDGSRTRRRPPAPAPAGFAREGPPRGVRNGGGGAGDARPLALSRRGPLLRRGSSRARRPRRASSSRRTSSTSTRSDAPRRVEALFALLGSRVSHSFSPAIHNAAFEALGLAALYVPVALGSLREELPRLREALAGFGLPLRGASVTIPFKEEASALAGGTAGSVVNTLLFGADGTPCRARTPTGSRSSARFPRRRNRAPPSSSGRAAWRAPPSRLSWTAAGPST